MFVKPARGLKVRDPIKKDHLPEAGREVPDIDLFWIRRVADRDVIVVKPVAAVPPSTRTRGDKE